MSIKPDPNNENLFKVRVAIRHPINSKPFGLKRIGIPTLAEAKRVEKELFLILNERAKESITPRWITCLQKYLDSLPNGGLTKKTIYSRERILKHYTIPIWENRMIDSINPNEIRELIEVSLKNNAVGYKKFFYQLLNGVFKFALDCDYIKKSPMPIIKWPKIDSIKTLLNENQMKELLIYSQQTDWPWYPHYAMALYTGMRTGELYALKWEQLNIEKRSIHVKTSWSSKDGFKRTKNNCDRIIEIPLPLLPTLIELKNNADGREFVLPRLRSWDHGEQARELRIILKALNLPIITFHDLRATWATLLLCKGVPPAVVMFMGGWAQLKTMMVYTRKAGYNIKGSTAVLDKFETHVQSHNG